MAELPGKQAIEHVVVLMLENRSFDSVLGSLDPPPLDFDGLKPEMANLDSEGTPILVGPTTATITDPDPLHDLGSVIGQLIGPNQGFVLNYETTLPRGEWARRRQVMDFQAEATVPLLHALAKEYAVSDRWFCSVPAQTWPNRLFVHCGTSFGQVSDRPPQWMPPKLYQAESIFGRLGRKKTDWACYNNQVPQMVVIQELADEFMRSRHEEDSHFRSLEQFVCDCKCGTLPRYSFIEPTYFFRAANDDHPPHDLKAGQQLIGEVYHAVRHSPLWEQTLLLILYDEHGGFFDHAPPPAPVPAPGPLPAGGESGFAFTRLGPRVPCILISAWTTKGKVFRPPDDQFFDHTSVIATLRERWSDLGKHLTARDAAAASIWSALDLAVPRTEDVEALETIEGLVDQLGDPPVEARFFRTEGSGLYAAAKVAGLAPLAGWPRLSQVLALSQPTGMNWTMAGLGALVATQAHGDQSRFDPAGEPPAR